MRTKLRRPGKNTSSSVEIQNISPYGIWILVNDQEFFLPYQEYPWFQDASVREICEVTLAHGHYLHWKKLDIDLELDSLKFPNQYPLMYK